MNDLWIAFNELARRRQSGMAANPICDLALEAFCRRKLMVMSSWEKDLIFRLDDAVRAAVDAGKPTTTPASAQEPAEIPVSDVKSVKGFFRSLGAKIKPKP